MHGGLLGGIASLVLASAASGHPLTCDVYRDRLNGGLMVSGEKIPESPVFRQKPIGAGDGKRFGWTTSDVSGTMTCGADGRFQEFYVSLEFVSKDKFADQLKHVVALNGGAICAFAAETPAVCAETGKAMLQDALQQLGSGFKRHVANPSGTSDRMLRPDLKAELTAAPTLITFSLAASDGTTVDEERQPLAPTDVKTSP